jgi:flagellar protein FliO/FliZ
MRSNGCRWLLGFAGAWSVLTSSTAFAENPSPTLVSSRPDAGARVPAPPRSKPVGSPSESSGGWWIGPAGMAAALAVFGGVSLASKRFLPSKDSGPFQVVGRSALSPKHSVYLLRVGDRVLILGAGPQGPPSTLGEVTDPVELARLAPRRIPRPDAAPRPSTGFDRRIGDDE